ncbi:MAG: STAS-like domain-containing protein [Spirochaetes bacterium]|nr:STAS-like domain-containing protein [Spirochaetota bacterium]
MSSLKMIAQLSQGRRFPSHLLDERMVIEIKKLAASVTVTRKSTDLFTRYVGRLLLQKICQKLTHLGEHEVVILDFNGIRSVDASFVDECIVPLIELSHTHDTPFYCKLVNITDNVEYIIHQVIGMVQQKRRYIIVTDRLCKNGCHALGAISEIEKDIIEYCVINKQATASDIALFLHIPESEAFGLLMNLFTIRAVRKINTDSVFYSI